MDTIRDNTREVVSSTGVIGELFIAKDAYRAIFGIDPDTGKEISTGDRVIDGVSVIPAGKLAKVGKYVFKMIKGEKAAKKVSKVEKGAETAKEVGKVEKSTSDVGKKASRSNFNDIIKNGERMPKHSEVKNKNSLPGKGEPNSSADLLNPDGTVKQRRYYDEQGKAKEDIDFNHSDDGTHTFPHRHKWDWSKKPPRQKPE